MTKTSKTDSLDPDSNKNGPIHALPGKCSNDKMLEPKPVYSNDLSIRINIQYTSHSIVIFKLTGNILQSTIPSLKNSLHANKQQHTFLILDMKDVSIISSAGWGLFIAEQKQLKDEHRTLFLTDFQPDLQQVFDSLQLHLMIQTFPSVTECLKYIYSEIKVTAPIKPPDRHQAAQSMQIQVYPNEESPLHKISNDPIDCILNAIAKHGPCSFFKLLSILQSNEYKKLKIGPLKLRSLLKEIELDTFEKRLRYFRSC